MTCACTLHSPAAVAGVGRGGGPLPLLSPRVRLGLNLGERLEARLLLTRHAPGVGTGAGGATLGTQGELGEPTPLLHPQGGLEEPTPLLHLVLKVCGICVS